MRKVEDGCVDAECAARKKRNATKSSYVRIQSPEDEIRIPKCLPDAGRGEQYAHGFAAQRAKVEKWRPVVVLVLVLDLALLVLQVQDCAALRMVERRGPVAGAEDERDEHGAGDGLQPEPPPDRIDRRLDEGGHHGNAESAARHDEDLHELAPLLEVLRHHQRGAVARHPNADTDDRTCKTNQPGRWC